MNPVFKVLLVILTLSLALVSGVLLYLKLGDPGIIAAGQKKAASSIPGLMWPSPKKLSPFQLTDHKGQPFDLNRLKGQWSLLFFGYTHCPDICPTTMTLLNAVVNDLEKKQQAIPQVIFISVDPGRDTQQHLNQYISYFNPGFIAVTGTEENLSAFTRQLGILSMKITDQANNNQQDYMVDHSASILMIDPDAQLLSIFSAPHAQDEIVQRYVMIRNFIESAN